MYGNNDMRGLRQALMRQQQRRPGGQGLQTAPGLQGMSNTPGYGPRPEMPGMGSQNWQEKLAAIQAASGGTQAPLQSGMPPAGPAMPGTQTLGGTGTAIPDTGGMQSMPIPFDPNGGLQYPGTPGPSGGWPMTPQLLPSGIVPQPVRQMQPMMNTPEAPQFPDPLGRKY